MVRSIDISLESLPLVDEHGTFILAPPDLVWSALVETIPKAFAGPGSQRAARALHCAETETSGPTGQIGSTIPGFIIARVVEPAVLALEGQHRFSRYGLIFRLEPSKDEKTTVLRAETRAEFPGLKGRAYRALVIGTRLHVVAVTRVLRAVRRRAQRAAS